MRAQTLKVSIERPAEQVYEFLCVPENFRRCAPWAADTVTVRFSDRNHLGVLDHAVEWRGGRSVYVPLRVVANGAGCELVLGLFRGVDMRDEEFAAVAERKMRALCAAKQLLEAESPLQE